MQVWVRHIHRGATDEDVIRMAAEQDRVIITRDKGFGDFVFRQGRRIGVVLIRSNRRSMDLANLICDALARRGDWADLFAVIEDDRVRTGPLPGA